MAGTRGAYWKPVQSGLEEITDTQWVQRATGLAGEHFLAETYQLRQPLSPHAAAAIDGVRIDLDAFKPPPCAPHNRLVVEGAGGLLVPLNERHFMLDLIVQLGLPVLLVASSQLGTINHTLLSLDQLNRRAVKVAGVVMNGPLNASNRQAIEQFGHVPVVAQIEPLNGISPRVLGKAFATYFALDESDRSGDQQALLK
jgi:dethiobiotin synthetase